jgi:hypothetical protein
MSSAQAQHESNKGIVEDDTAVTLLHHLESERGRMYTEAEYQEMRQAVIDELTEGARCRPFTLFTFGVVALILLTMMILGLVTAFGNTIADFTLAIVSGLALASAAYFFWTHLHGIRSDALRSVEERLAEIEALRSQRLVSPEEYEIIHSRILIARQKTRSA